MTIQQSSSKSRSTPRRVIRPETGWKRAGFSPATFWRRAKSDPKFPRLFRLGHGSRAVGMYEDEFEAWLAHYADLQVQAGNSTREQ